MVTEVTHLLEKLTFDDDGDAKQFESGIVQLVQGDWAPEVASDEGEVEPDLWNERKSTYTLVASDVRGWEMRPRVWQAPKVSGWYFLASK